MQDKHTNTDSVYLIYTEAKQLLSEKISDDHRRDLKNIIDKFLVFLIAKSLYNQPVNSIKTAHIEEFLADFHTDGQKGKYYYNMFKRLNILFNSLVKNKYVSYNMMDALDINKTAIDQSVSVKTYFDQDTLTAVVDYLKNKNQQLYLYALINYHLMIKSTSVRKIKRSDFNADLTVLSLSETDGQLSYTITPALSTSLKELFIDSLEGGLNIFTHSAEEFSQSTFFKKWAKVKSDLLSAGIIDHDEYDVEVFANTHVHEIYSRNGDVFEIQRLLNRSTTYKTKEYLKKLFRDEFDTIVKRGN